MANNILKVTVLGSGTSQGVPVISCTCHVCKSNDPKDNRLRSSIHLQWGEFSCVIDTGPDFRQQMLREKISSLNAVVFTHEHKDHIAGLDDVRAFNYLQNQETQIYATDQVQNALKREFHYIFSDFKYPGIPQVNLNTIKNEQFEIGGKTILPIEGLHYKLPVLGFRIEKFAYITDINSISEDEKSKLKNLEVLILNCLRKEKHISHFNEEEALALINEVKPKKTYLTHISHLYGTHEEIASGLPLNVEPAFDGLVFQL